MKARAGDTVTIAALLTANNKVGSIAFSQISGPNAAIIGAWDNTKGWATSLADTARVPVSGLITGTYVIGITGKDLAGGSISGIDTIIVSAAPPPCPICPPAPTPRTVVGAQLFILGQWITVPAGSLKLTLSDGATQSY